MAMMASTALYTKNNKIKLYLRFKNTRERRSEFGAVGENKNPDPYALWSIQESSKKRLRRDTITISEDSSKPLSHLLSDASMCSVKLEL